MTVLPPMSLARTVPVGCAWVMSPDHTAGMNALADADRLGRLRHRRLFEHGCKCAKRKHHRHHNRRARQRHLRPLPQVLPMAEQRYRSERASHPDQKSAGQRHRRSLARIGCPGWLRHHPKQEPQKREQARDKEHPPQPAGFGVAFDTRGRLRTMGVHQIAFSCAKFYQLRGS